MAGRAAAELQAALDGRGQDRGRGGQEGGIEIALDRQGPSGPELSSSIASPRSVRSSTPTACAPARRISVRIRAVPVPKWISGTLEPVAEETAWPARSSACAE